MGERCCGGQRIRTCLPQLVLLWEVDQLVHNFTFAEMCPFFDDLSLATKGTKEFVEKQHPLLVEAAVAALEDNLDQPISRGIHGKSVATATKEVERAVDRQGRRIGI